MRFYGNFDATQHYKYDALNRLGIVAEGVNPAGPDTCPTTTGTWCREFGYERYGNRAVDGNYLGGLSLATPTATSVDSADQSSVWIGGVPTEPEGSVGR